MSLNRYAKKRDTSEPKIVEALEAAGFSVWRELPVDLLVWRADKGFHALECKSLYGKKAPKARVDKRREAQINFLAKTGAPVVTNGQQALAVLGVGLYPLCDAHRRWPCKLCLTKHYEGCECSFCREIA